MGEATGTAMDAIEIDDFLGERTTGVLSLGRENVGYGIPVSFAYHDGDVFFRLGYAPGSEKRRFVDAAERAAFVVYGQSGEGWKSVVARGPLEELSDTSLDSTVAEAVDDLEIPFFAVHDRPAEDLEFNVVRMHVEQIDGVDETGR